MRGVGESEGWPNGDVCLPAKSISRAGLGRGRQLTGALCYRTLKDTVAGHQHACPLRSLPSGGGRQREREKDGRVMTETKEGKLRESKEGQ